MSNYVKPQSPLKIGENYIYPITADDQIITEDGQRLNTKYITAILNEEDTGITPKTNSDQLGGLDANAYATKDYVLVEIAKAELNGGGDNDIDLSGFMLKTDTAINSEKLGGKSASEYALKENFAEMNNSIITLTQAEFDALSQTDIANYHANGVRTILVKGVSESGEPVFMRLDVAMQLSDEQKENVVESLGLDERYGGLKMELLWENADAALSFPEQILNIPELVNYEYIAVIYWAGGDRGYNSSGIVKKGKVVLPIHGNTCGERTLTISGENISVSSCVEYTVYGAATTAVLNHFSVPAFIYGIKGVNV